MTKGLKVSSTMLERQGKTCINLKRRVLALNAECLCAYNEGRMEDLRRMSKQEDSLERQYQLEAQTYFRMLSNFWNDSTTQIKEV